MFDEQFRQATADILSLSPYYRYSNDGFSVNLGVRFSEVWREGTYEDGYINTHYEVYIRPVADYNGRKVFPDVRVSYEAVPDKLVLSAKVTGGQRFNTFGSYLESNHHFSYASRSIYFSTIGDATVNTFDAGLGISGRVKSRMQYAAEAGYARYYNAPLESIAGAYIPQASAPSLVFIPVIMMMNYDLLYAGLSGSVTSDRVDASARMKLQKTNLSTDVEKGLSALPLPLFSGSADFVYNWNRRFFAGLSAQWATSRDEEGLYWDHTRVDCHVPGWVDLGVSAEFRLNSRLSLWAQGRNLLNQTVMRNVFIAEKGPYFTAGICLNL